VVIKGGEVTSRKFVHKDLTNVTKLTDWRICHGAAAIKGQPAFVTGAFRILRRSKHISDATHVGPPLINRANHET
jgi:hypothetical protein